MTRAPRAAVADGEHGGARPAGDPSAHAERRDAGRVDGEHGEVAVDVDAGDLGLAPAAVGEGHRGGRGPAGCGRW